MGGQAKPPPRHGFRCPVSSVLEKEQGQGVLEQAQGAQHGSGITASLCHRRLHEKITDEGEETIRVC